MEDKEVRIFKVPTFNFDWFQKKMNKLIKSAEKCGCEIPTYETSETYDIVFKKGTPKEYAVSYQDITVTGIRPSINGFNFIGKVEHLEAGNLLKMMPSYEEQMDLSKYYTGAQTCNHCNTKRKRKDTYLVMKDDSTEVIQVGRSCLKDFIGHASPEYYARLAELDYDLEEEVSASREGNGIGSREEMLPIRPVLLVATAMIRMHEGYRTSGTHDYNSTSNRTHWYFHGSNSFNTRDWDEYKEEVDSFRREEDKEYVESVITWGRSLEGKNDFENNMKVLITGEHIHHGNYGIFCYTLQAFSKFETKKADWQLKKEADALKKNEYVGELKDRNDFTNLTYDKTRSFEGEWGTTYFHYFEDSEGRSIINKGTKSIEEVTGLDYDKCSDLKFSLKGTVSDHKEYNGRLSTYINRVKLLKVS